MLINEDDKTTPPRWTRHFNQTVDGMAKKRTVYVQFDKPVNGNILQAFCTSNRGIQKLVRLENRWYPVRGDVPDWKRGIEEAKRNKKAYGRTEHE